MPQTKIHWIRPNQRPKESTGTDEEIELMLLGYLLSTTHSSHYSLAMMEPLDGQPVEGWSESPW